MIGFAIRQYLNERTELDEKALSRASKFAAKNRTRGFNKNMHKIQDHAKKWKSSVAAELKKMRVDPKKVDQNLASTLMQKLTDVKASAMQLAATVGRAQNESVHMDADQNEFFDSYGDSGGWDEWLPPEEKKIESHLSAFRTLAGLAPPSGLPHLASDGDRPRGEVNHSGNLFDEGYTRDFGKKSPGLLKGAGEILAKALSGKMTASSDEALDQVQIVGELGKIQLFDSGRGVKSGVMMHVSGPGMGIFTKSMPADATDSAAMAKSALAFYKSALRQSAAKAAKKMR